jgi:integrase/recombinase XerD
MRAHPILPALIERFFTERLMRQRNVSPHTIASYRDTFRLLLAFARDELRKSPSQLDLRDFDAPFISRFLEDLENVLFPLRCLRRAGVQRAHSTRARHTEQTG